MTSDTEQLVSRLSVAAALDRWSAVLQGVAMSKFTIEVSDEVSVAPLAIALAQTGYTLKRLEGRDVLELAETPARRTWIENQARAQAERKAMIANFTPAERESLRRSEAARHRMMDAGMEP